MSRNPFKFGTVVGGDYFTDRREELETIKRVMDSENHLILISPRRFGKTSLVNRAVEQMGRPCVAINMQKIVSSSDFAATILKEVFKQHKWEKLKHVISRFRVVPMVTTNPVTGSVDVAFQPTVSPMVALEDAFSLLEAISTAERRLIVVLDEFQEIAGLEKGIDKKLRAIMQGQTGINYILLGSQESMMTEIFERKKSPFYHFGQLMRLKKIPYDDFFKYVVERLPLVEGSDRTEIAVAILERTKCHPYYTQQLSAQVWDIMEHGEMADDVVEQAAGYIMNVHDLDFERLWVGFNNTDKRIMQNICRGLKPQADRSLPTSTVYSSLKRLMKAGYVIRNGEYELEDPFFRKWICERRL